VPLLSVLTALIFGAFVIVFTDLEHLSQLGSDPGAAILGALGGVGRGYGAMLAGAFGDPGRILNAIQSGNLADIATAIRPLSETLVAATPLIFVGLAVAVSFRTGMFNIGGNGQLMLGALGATAATIGLQTSGLPSILILVVAVTVGTLFGAAWGFIPGLAGLVSLLLFRTTKGFELRAAGFNMTAARYAGMSAAGSMILGMSISGALAGMGGGLMVIGTIGQLTLDIHGNIGFNAIALALLAGLRPSGVVLAALLFGALTTGGKLMGIQSGIPFDLLFLIMALVIMFVAAPGLIRAIWRIRVSKPPPEVATVSQGAEGTL
jgi:ABC-type uncharacterized transport system permease subunit